jgi:hypothetical protein
MTFYRFIAALFLFTPIALMAQTLRGDVRDQHTNLPISGARVYFHTTDKVTTLSAENGTFRFDALPSGIGLLTVDAEGYVPFSLSEVSVAAGKERIVAVLLTPGNVEATITPVDIVETRPLRQTMSLGEIPLSREQNLYYPMTYYDPARLAMAWPGVVQTDDGTNGMSVRGNNPGLVRWKLNGVDIINPNHLPNAGTFSDRPAVGGGGVLMLSAQMIDNSSLITGAGTVGYNDGIGGIMDLNLRKGNNQRHEQTIQAGLIGLDAAVEGPLSKKKRGSYLMNYRYSTVGLLGLMGVSFGGEKITFQDFALNIHLPGKQQKNAWSIYAVAGNSKNIFTKPDSATVYKELSNIDFHSKTIITGISHTGYNSSNWSYKTGLSFSTQTNNRLQQQEKFESRNAQDQSRLTINHSSRVVMSPYVSFLFGINFSVNGFQTEDQTATTVPYSYSSFYTYSEDVIAQGWLAGESSFNEGRIKVHFGINPITSIYGTALDPRIQFYWKPSEQHQFIASVAGYSQAAPLWQQAPFQMIHASNYAIRYNYNTPGHWILSAEAFTQGVSDILIKSGVNDGYSYVNETERNGYFLMSPSGTANNTGIELMALRRFSQGWFLNANATLLRSVYQGSDGITRRSRWDVGQIANLTAGREWHRKNRRKLSGRLFGVDGRAVFSGGMRSTPVDASASAAQSQTVFIYTNGYSEKERPYFRLDGRIYWKRSIQNRRNSTFALEFQNLTMQQNLAYRYFDPFTQKVENKYQLGLIPNLSWRVEL